MTLSIWRYSHLTLAISSALFIIIASLTGIVLALEPISNQLKPYNSVELKTVSVAETISQLNNKYDEIVTIEIDENNFVSTSVITKKGKSETFYINPKTGEKIGEIIQKKPIFEFATNLHRSLFLKSTGRFLVGLFALLLLLISITGIILISKRQGGFLKIFSTIIKEDFNQYYHIIFGRWFLIPIVIITLSGVYLSLEKFSLLPKDNNIHQNITLSEYTNKKNLNDFEVFKSTSLDKVHKIEFPFSSDEEDYFFVKLDDKEVAIHQFTGQIISEKKVGLVTFLSIYNLVLHTGKGSLLWAIILFVSCFAILFFIFSGFSMTLKRRKSKAVFQNQFYKDEVEYVILVGSETGLTNNFAIRFFNALLKVNKSVFIGELNDYSTFQKAQNIIIFTATYGNGDAPSNARHFIKKVQSITPKKVVNFSVLGFGSSNYPEFCKFAILVQANLQLLDKFTPTQPLFKIDNQSVDEFKKWVNEWSRNNRIELQIDYTGLNFRKEKQDFFKVIYKSNLNLDDTFTIALQPLQKTKFTSGDLISIIPKNEQKRRLYSIAKVDNTILLSIKKHELGVCSNYLNTLSINDKIEATIQQNKLFHFPKKAKEVILIANGTGITPFLGMIKENKKAKIHLLWGGKTLESFDIYKRFLKTEATTTFQTALSKQHKEKIYVQDILKKHTSLITNILSKGNYIMICGSLSMQNEVLKILNEITHNTLKSPIEKFQKKNLIKTDCY